MKSRPWPLVILALIQIFTPVVTVFFNATALHVSPLRVLAWILDRGPQGFFESICLMPIAGFAIYSMKKWSYPIFLLAMGWSAFRNLSHWAYATTLIPKPALAFVYISEAAFVGYFLLPSVRTTYFDPNVRWWEHKPRYLLELAASIAIGATRRVGTILNVSEGGAFVSVAEKIEKGARIRLEFTVVTLLYSVEGIVAHVRELEGGKFCYGIQFTHSTTSLQALRNLAEALDILGYNDRDGRGSPLEEFRAWITRLLKTGRGLVPEIKRRRI